MYAESLTCITRSLLERDGHLFDSRELSRLRELAALPLSARTLLARLLCRREGWIRQESLRYPEVGETIPLLQSLDRLDWLERWPGDSDSLEMVPPDLISQLRRPELSSLLQRAGTPAAGNRVQLAERLVRLVAEELAGRPLSQTSQAGLWPEPSSLELLRESGPWVRIREPEWFRLLFLAHCGTSGATLKDFVLARMGLQPHEDRLLPTGALFPERGSLLALKAAVDLSEEVQAGLEALPDEETALQAAVISLRTRLRELDRLARPLPSETSTTRSRLQRARLVRRSRLACARSLEHAGRHGTACRLLESVLHDEEQDSAWRASLRRLLVDLAHWKGRSTAAVRAHELLPRVRSAVLRSEIQTRTGQPAPLPDSLLLSEREALIHPGWRGPKALYQGRTGAALTIEEWLLEVLVPEGWNGLHCESHLFNAMAGLLCWDLMFAPIPGAFQHSLQAAPLDWREPGFLARRQSHLEAIVTRIREGSHRSLCHEHLRDKSGMPNPLVSWSWMNRNRPSGTALCRRKALRILLAGLDPEQCRAICLRIAGNPVDARSGAPDLLLWRREGKGLQLRFCEIKGPRDRLQTNQTLWLEFLASLGLEVELVRIKERRTSP